jgi:hypothetical protein
MALHDIHYRPWKGRHQPIWRRRAVIAEQGLRACLANRWMRYAVTLSWGMALAQASGLFIIGQLLVEDSLVMQWAATLRGGAQALVGGLAKWLADHPEVCVRTAENVMFYGYASLALTLNLVVVMLAIPHLITRDLATHALLIYASKALTRWDYLLGKLGALMGLLCLTWLGPACAAWFVGNLLAPEWHFFWHARTALLHTTVFVTGAALFLSLLGLGVSALSSKEKNAVGLWLVLWLVGNTMVPIGQQTTQWLQYLSFRYDLQQVAGRVFRPGEDLERLQREIPVFGDFLRQAVPRRPQFWTQPRVGPACIGLGLMGLGAALLLQWRTRTE